MAKKKEWNEPANQGDNKFTINVTSLAHMVEIQKGTEPTGKKNKGEVYGGENIYSTALIKGDVTAIKAFNDNKEKADKADNIKE